MVGRRLSASVISEGKSLFKSACEACSRSKVKCGGGSPCANCRKRGVECMYAFKKKRGPKKVSHRNENPTANLKASHMSSYERRVWSLFFTIFKNQKKNAADNPFSWEWFVEQIVKLETYVSGVEKEKSERLRSMLEGFCEMLDISGTGSRKRARRHSHSAACEIPAHICTICSSAVFKNLGESIPADYKIRLPLPVLDKRTMEQVDPWKMSSFDQNFNEGKRPCLIYTASPDNYGVYVNDLFTKTFAYDQKSLVNLVSWSGGGFLPWGADILSALLVHEADCLLYMQIMAVKYQAQGLPVGEELKKMFPRSWENERQTMHQHLKTISYDQDPKSEFGYEFVVPSLHAFQCWINPDQEGLPDSVNVDEVKEKLVPRMVQFSCTLRLRRGSEEKVHMRLELMLINDDMSQFDDMNMMAAKKKTLPERVSHDSGLGSSAEARQAMGIEAKAKEEDTLWYHKQTKQPAAARALTLRAPPSPRTEKEFDISRFPLDNDPMVKEELGIFETTLDELFHDVGERPLAFPQWREPVHNSLQAASPLFETGSSDAIDSSSSREGGRESANGGLVFNGDLLDVDEKWLESMCDWAIN